MRILVTGGAGYIGSHTVRLLTQQGHDPWVYDNLSTGHRAAAPADRLIVADLADLDRLDHALVAHRIEAVMHFAAHAYVGESVLDPAKFYRNNLANSIALLDRMHRHGIRRFVFSSTCATYGIPARVPIDEEAPQQPINPYGRTKLAIEWALADFCRAYQFGGAILRYFNAAGASADGKLGEDHEPETHLIPRAILAALGCLPHVEIFGTDYPTRDGTCIRDYVHVDDLAEAHRVVLERLTPGACLAYNVATGRGSSVREVIRAVEKISGRPVPVIESPRRAGDPAELTADAAAIHRDLGWTPRYADLHAIIATAWNWHQSHPSGFDAGPARQSPHVDELVRIEQRPAQRG